MSHTHCITLVKASLDFDDLKNHLHHSFWKRKKQTAAGLLAAECEETSEGCEGSVETTQTPGLKSVKTSSSQAR